MPNGAVPSILLRSCLCHGMSKEWESGFLAGWVNLELPRGQSCKEFSAVLAVVVASQELVAGVGDCNRSVRLKVSDVGDTGGGQIKLRFCQTLI